MRLAQLLGEEDEFGAVLLETLDVLLQRLHALVTATVVNRDADRSGKGDGEGKRSRVDA